MLSILTPVLVTVLVQDQGRLDAVVAELAPPPTEEALSGLARPKPLEEVLALSDSEDHLRADRMRTDLDLALWEIAKLRADGSYDRAFERASTLCEELEETLGPAHPFVRTAEVQVEMLEVILNASRQKQADFRRSDELTPEVFSKTQQGDWPGALESSITQLDLSLRLFGRESEDVAAAAYNVALLSERSGDHLRAERLAALALDLRRRIYGDEHPFVADALHQVGTSLRSLGRYTEADRCLRAALQSSAQLFGPLSGTALVSANNLADVHLQLGEHDVARQLYEHCLRGSGALSAEDLATTHDNFGVVLFRGFGLLDEAEEHHRASLEIRRKVYAGLDHDSLAVGLANLEAICLARGDLDEAESFCREALAMKQRIWGSDHVGSALEYGRLASLLLERGDLTGAERHMRRAVELFRTPGQGSKDQLPYHLRELGILLLRAGRADEAGASVEEAVKLYTGLFGERHTEVAQCQGVLAAIALAQGRREEARRLSIGALAVERELLGAGHPSLALGEERLGEIELLDGELGGARAHFEEALRIVRQGYGPGNPREARLAGKLAGVAWKQGRREDALAHWRDAFEISDQRRRRVAGAEQERALYAQTLGHRQLARMLAWALLVEGRADESFDAIERGRDRVLRDLLARSEQDLVAEVARRDPEAGNRLASLLAGEEETSRHERSLSRRVATEGARLPAGDPRRAALEEELAEARAHLHDSEAAVHLELRSMWPDARPLTVAEARAALAEREVLVSYVWSPLGVGMLLVPPVGDGVIERFVIASGETAVDALREAVEVELGRTRSAGGALDSRAAAALSDLLLPAAIRERLLGSRRIVVIPDGPLNELAFDALPLSGGLLLNAGPEIVLASSASLFTERRKLARARTSPVEPRCLVVGDPRAEAVASPAALDLRPLVGSSLEAREIGRIVERVGGSARLLTGTQARRAAVDEAAPELTHLHFACHGVVGSDEDAYASGLTLADEALDLEHLLRSWRGRLAGAELVVLSACDTQRAVKLGDADVSLPWGFFYAGAPTVVATLWKVDDSAGALLMTRFYENLLGAHAEERRAGERRLAPGARAAVATALREAKLWLRDQTPEANRARLAELGLEPSGLRGEDDPPGPLEPPRVADSAELWDYSHPRFWAPFVVFGAGE